MGILSPPIRTLLFKRRTLGDPLYDAAGQRPAVDFRLFNSTLTDSISGATATLTRASTRWFWDGSTYTSVANNLPGYAVDVRSGARGLAVENSSTNQIRNPINTGAVAGTPGTLPTNWYVNNVGTLSRQVVGFGTILGLPYIDLRFFGTSSTTSFNISPESNTQIVAANGQTWTMSYWLALIAAPGNAPDKYEMLIAERQAGGTTVTSRLSGGMLLPSAIQIGQRFEHTVTLNGGVNVARINPNLQVRIQNATTYDFTIRIAGWQIEQKPRATAFIPSQSNAATTRSQETIVLTGASLPASGTLVVRYRPAVTGAAAVAAALSDGTTNNVIQVGHGATGGAAADVTAGGAAQVALTTNNTQFPGLRTAVLRYAANNVGFVTDDTAAQVDASATLPTIDRLNIGSILGGNSIDGTIERVTVFAAPLSDATMLALQPRRTLNVFLVGGQSNANGTGNLGGGGPHYLTTSIIPDVFAWNGTVLRQFDIATFGASGDGRNFTSGTSAFFSFAAVALRELAFSMENVCACWITQSGTSLNTNWNPNYALVPGGTVALAQELENRFRSLATYCANNNITLNVRGFLWHQGESDSSTDAQNAYQTNFQNLINSIRSYTGKPTLPVLYGTTATSGPAGVRTAHLAIDAADSNAWCRINDDLGTSDGTHFNDAGIAVFGRWVASTYLANYGAT